MEAGNGAVAEFTLDDPPPFEPPAIVFMRPDPELERLEQERALFLDLSDHGWITIPDRATIEVYEDKWEQAKRYGRWMPGTLLLSSKASAKAALRGLSFPVVSKSKTGAGSCNVRLLAGYDDALAEIRAVFGDGLDLSCAFGEQKQTGYLIWQEFLPDNEGDYRVIVTGRYRMLLRRYNHPERPFASGSGLSSPIIDLSREVRSVLDYADAFLQAEELQWCGLDMVRDRAGQWKLLETTPAWTLPGYADCVYFDADNRPSGYQGRDMWTVLLNEIEAGVFGLPSSPNG